MAAGETAAPDVRRATLEWDPRAQRRVGRITLRVRYAETDRMGNAYNAHYLTWFEIGRTEYMRCMGLPYREVEDRGIYLPLVATQLKLRGAIRYDDVLTTETWIAAVRSRTVTFAYRILCEGRVVAEGTTEHAGVQASTGRACRLPAWLCEAIEKKTT